MPSFQKRVLLLVTIVLSFACAQSPQSPAEKTSRSFVEAYYVEANLAQALQFTDGLAASRVQSSLQLREGQAIDASTHQPKVSFKSLSSEVEGEEAVIFYEIRIQPEEMDPMLKKTRIKLRKVDGAWKVTQFSDFQL